MIPCIARSKASPDDSADKTIPNSNSNSNANANSASKQSIRNVTSQIKEMVLKASGAYSHCNSCAREPNERRITNYAESHSSLVPSERFRWSYRRTGSSNSSSSSSMTMTAGRKELEARLKGISSGEGTPVSSASGRRPVEPPVVFVDENEPKEWVAQVEPGVLITFVSLPRGTGNDLKRIRFSREMFNKWQAQRWWAENYEKVMELYNVQRMNRQAFPLPTPPRSEDESSKMGRSIEDSPVTPPLNREPLPRTMCHLGPAAAGRGYYSSSDSNHSRRRQNYDATCGGNGVLSTPKLSSLSSNANNKTEETSSMRTSSSRDDAADRSGDISISNASDLETEWVEQDAPGVYITIRALPDGTRELRRVRFSRDKFGEMHARLWWGENRARVHKQYL